MYFTKKPRVYNKKTKLSRKDAFELESAALTKLTNGYKCYCSEVYKAVHDNDKKEDEPEVTFPAREHFPRILSSEYDNKMLRLSSMGQSLDNKNVRRKVNAKCESDPTFVMAQLTCITKNLINCGVYHVDCPMSGQNMCWDSESETLALIDFDACVIDGQAKSSVLRKWRKLCGDNDMDYKKFFAAQMLLVCKESRIK